MNAHGDTLVAAEASSGQPDLEAVFTTHYARISRVLARVVQDHARAEELAVEVFLKWPKHARTQGVGAAGWLYRTAVRMGVDELRRRARRSRSERLIPWLQVPPPTPEDVRSAKDDRQRVRVVLAALRGRDVELLVLRSQGFRYEDLAAMLGLNPASVGTLLSRAQQAFRKEYVRRYGTQ